MKKTYNLLVAIFFLIIILYFPIKTKFEPNQETSFIENRTLKTVPVISKETFLDGSYFSEWDSYFSDHLAHRDSMIFAYTYIQANIINKTVVNNVVLTEKVLLPYNAPEKVDINLIRENSAAMAEKLLKLQEAVNNAGGEFLYVGIPEQSSMFRNEYPRFLENRNKYFSTVEAEFFSALDSNGVSYLNMMDIFSNEDYSSYYSVTDHHYNIHGAFRTYEAIIDKLNIDNCLTIDDYDLVTLKNTFFGSRAKLIYNAYPIEEKLSYYEPKIPVSFRRYDSGVALSRIFFAPSNPNDNIAYSVYMGGDNAETYIYTDRPELKKILIFGDSFTNPLETIMYPSFDTTLTIDLRHNKQKSIYEYINEFKPDIVLLVRDDTCYLSFDGNGSF